MDQSLQILGLAKKAALLQVGLDDVSKAARTKNLFLIISASDASDGAKRRAGNEAEFCGTVYAEVPYTMQELGAMTGRGSPGTIAFLEPGLAAKFLRGLAAQHPEKFEGKAELLEQYAIEIKAQNKNSKHSAIGRAAI